MPKWQCEEALDRLFEFIDGELSDEDLLRIGAHFKECPPCEAEHKINERIRLLVSQAHGEKAPHELRERVLSTLQMARDEYK